MKKLIFELFHMGLIVLTSDSKKVKLPDDFVTESTLLKNCLTDCKEDHQIIKLLNIDHKTAKQCLYIFDVIKKIRISGNSFVIFDHWFDSNKEPYDIINRITEALDYLACEDLLKLLEIHLMAYQTWKNCNLYWSREVKHQYRIRYVLDAMNSTKKLSLLDQIKIRWYMWLEPDLAKIINNH